MCVLLVDYLNTKKSLHKVKNMEGKNSNSPSRFSYRLCSLPGLFCFLNGNWNHLEDSARLLCISIFTRFYCKLWELTDNLSFTTQQGLKLHKFLKIPCVIRFFFSWLSQHRQNTDVLTWNLQCDFQNLHQRRGERPRSPLYRIHF